MQFSLPQLSYTHKNLTDFQPPIRNDGRAANQLRAFSGQVDVLPGANGSARVKCGSVVEVVVGVKAEIGEADSKRGGAFLASVEVPTFIAQQNRENDPVPAFLTRSMQALLDQLDTKYLQFTPSRAWTVYVDAVVVTCAVADEQLLTALSLATRLALLCTRIPRISTPDVSEDIIGSSKYEPSEEFDADPDWDHALPLQGLDAMSVIVAASVVDQVVLIDPTPEEASVSQATYAVAVQPSGNIAYTRSILNAGGYASTGLAVSPAQWLEMTQVASKAGIELVKASDQILSFSSHDLQDILP
ncbi:exosome subunit Rrp42 [Schizosaccharomyces japonicus yFS275]|uniref:Ribosomal RNA-processing protein 42 n=1 Tax=Schizosaccharomyces japonicus (strain yFS275 / FY16936) TaxID=402676 RepID=B6K7U6_SCHJY|nr:exosome subunit Rrp42 [Schizosaccharomyces japonicus yFS275]EEB09600.1 exosome subunit Rrp42 [Schizosaccharomyces japonicus yFS275]